MKTKSISGNIVDVLNSEVYPGIIELSGTRIAGISRGGSGHGNYLLPGFVDSHIHIESSMLVPSEFARAASVHGTIATVSDPHEIANVLGVEGVKYMLENARKASLKLYFAAPSCVPASAFETSGAALDPKQVSAILSMDGVKCLGEVMNYPGVLSRQPEVMEKIAAAKKLSKKVDGHAPGLMGEEAVRYASAGISTDHESSTLEEALDKIRAGMRIQIREGSAAKNFEALSPLLEGHHESCMFCSDDKHPDDLLKGHINVLVKKALAEGFDLMKVLKVACVNPVLHYGLDVGLLRPGDPADFIVVDSLDELRVLGTYVNGELVAEGGRPAVAGFPPAKANKFSALPKKPGDFRLAAGIGCVRVIGALDGQLVTEKLVEEPKVIAGETVADASRDLLKIAVVNRYCDSRPSVALAKGFGLKRGAIASSVAHDSHNIIAVGVDDESICKAVNLVIGSRGGVSAVSPGREVLLPLPVAGLMSDLDYMEVAERYTEAGKAARALGSAMHAPFMTLSFMALLVIPKIKLSDRGLFDGEKFGFTSLFVD